MTTPVHAALSAAQDIVSRQLQEHDTGASPDGRITFDGEEYVLLRKEIFSELERLLGENGARVVMYDLGERMGRAEAKSLFARGDIPSDAVVRLLLRPFYYMSRGLGTVDLLRVEYEDGQPESLVVLYEDRRPVFPYLVCGFSAGWKSEVVGAPLAARPVCESADGLRVLVCARDRLLSLIESPEMSAPRSAFTPLEVRIPKTSATANA